MNATLPPSSPGAVAIAAPRHDLAWLRRRAARRLRTCLQPANRALLVEMIRSTFKVTDHNSIMGALWGLIAPFAMLVALYLIFRNRFGEELRAYPLYLLLGITFVNYFATTTRFLIAVLQLNRALLLDTSVPRETVFLSQVGFHSYKLLVEIGFCALLAVHYGTFSWTSLLASLPIVVAFVAFVLGVGLLGAIAHSFARDIEHLWALLSRVLLFVTPVFYSLESLSAPARFVITWLNPLTPFLTAMRGFLIGPPAGAGVYLHAMVVGFGVLTLGYATYLALESVAVERT